MNIADECSRFRALMGHVGKGGFSSMFPDEPFLIRRGGVSLKAPGFIAQSRGHKESMNHH
jgi:hypothetical protein